jgi:hypothetical protein
MKTAFVVIVNSNENYDFFLHAKNSVEKAIAFAFSSLVRELKKLTFSTIFSWEIYVCLLKFDLFPIKIGEN